VAGNRRWRDQGVARDQAGRDASEADLRVLEHQLQSAEPLTLDEQAVTVTYDAEAPLERSRQAEAWRSVLERLRRQIGFLGTAHLTESFVPTSSLPVTEAP